MKWEDLFYITQLSGKVASSAHIEYHARIIAQKFLARELISFTSNIQTKSVRRDAGCGRPDAGGRR